MQANLGPLTLALTLLGLSIGSGASGGQGVLGDGDPVDNSSIDAAKAEKVKRDQEAAKASIAYEEATKSGDAAKLASAGKAKDEANKQAAAAEADLNKKVESSAGKSASGSPFTIGRCSASRRRSMIQQPTV